MKTHQALALTASVESNLSNDALYFLRKNPDAWNNPLVLAALSHMDDCASNLEDEISEEHNKEISQAETDGEIAAIEYCNELIDAALYFADHPGDEDNNKDLIEQAKLINKYRDNLNG